MKASELMIGDWIDTAEGMQKVTAVFWDGEVQFEKDGTTFRVFEDADDEEYFAPVPLTPEILEKNGFKQVDMGGETCIRGEYLWGDKGKRNFTVVRITYYKGLSSGVNLLTKIETDSSHDNGINMVHSCDIEYVHQLQHVLRLCGVEKEIVL